jgi:fatty-acyl-CoA synthase
MLLLIFLLIIFQRINYITLTTIQKFHERFNDGISINSSHYFKKGRKLIWKKEIVSRLPDKSIHRYTYYDFAIRTKKLSVALQGLDIRQGDRVATLCWNHYQHLEAYFAIPCMGAIVHPLNIRLSPDDLGYIVNHAEDKIIIVDEVLLPLFEKLNTR